MAQKQKRHLQVIKRLVDSGYVEKRFKENNEKSVCLYATDKGQRLSSVHKAYDVADITQTTSYLIEQCGQADVDAFTGSLISTTNFSSQTWSIRACLEIAFRQLPRNFKTGRAMQRESWGPGMINY